MLKNYLKVALRSFIKYKGYTIINLLGLSVSICCCLLIMLLVRNEFSYDKFHSKADRLYRAWMFDKDEGREVRSTITTLPLGPALQTNIPDVELSSRVYNFNTLVKNDRNSFNESVHMTDTSFFKMFDFKLKEGDLQHPWPTSNSIIISEDNVKKYFNKEKAIGKNIELQMGDDKVLFTVSGVVENNPPESSIKIDFLIPFSNDHYLFNERMRTRAWGNVFTETYVLLKMGSTRYSFEKKMHPMIQQVTGGLVTRDSYNIYLQPITDIHLDTSLPEGIEPISNPKNYYILATVGFFILIIACVNFITISIGRSTSRSMEVGVRKVLGAGRKQLVRQFWGEAYLLILLSLIIGFLLTVILFKPFNQLTGKDLNLQFDPVFFSFCFLLMVTMALLAGFYPALVLSGFKPVEVLKGKFKNISGMGFLSKILITGQFVVSVTLIICTLVAQQQLDYLKNKSLGYKSEHVVIVPTNLPAKDGIKLAELYQNALSKLPEVINSSTVMYGLDESPWAVMGYTDISHINRNFQFNSVDASFLQTMNISLLEGNNFFSNNDSSILVNETYVKEYGLQNPVGKKLPGPFNQRIIGVVKDFNIESLHTKIKPLVLTTNFETIARTAETMMYPHALKPKISIRLRAGNLSGQIADIKTAWQRVTPGQDFEYRFLDQKIALQYEEDERAGMVIKWASALSIFIACMGLFGMVTQVVVNRTREIGIRKVLGAGTIALVTLLSKDFLKIIFISITLASPVAWLFMRNWLQDFAYRVDINWKVFLLAALAAFFIALVTIGFQTIKAAIANPVKSLRTE